MEPIIFQKAGRIMITPYSSTGTLDIPGTCVAISDAVQKVSASITKNTKEIEDGNTDWPAAVVETGKQGKVSVTFGIFSPELLAALLGTTVASASNQSMWAIAVPYTISASNAITLAQAPFGTTVPIVIGTDGTRFTKVASGPTTGQFSISGSTLTFAVADANKPVKVTYQYSASTQNSFGMAASGSSPAVNIVIDGEATNMDGNNVQDCNITVDKCMVDGDLNFPDFAREPGPWTLNFKVMNPRGGYKAVNVQFNNNVNV